MRVWGIAVLGIAGLGLTACGGGKKALQANGSQASTTSTAVVPAVTPGSTTTAPGGGAATTVKAGAAAGATVRPTGTTVKSATASGGSRVGAAPGHYTYDVSGTRTGGAPATTAPVSGKTILTMDPLAGNTQHSTVAQQGSSSPQTEETFAYTPSQILFVDLKLNQIGKEFTPNPPLLAAPVPPTVGQKWSWDMKSTDGTTTVHGDLAYTGQETLNIGGQSIRTYVLSVNLTFTVTYAGAPSGVIVHDSETEWLDPGRDLQVKIHDVLDAGAYGKGDTTSVLESVNPS